MDAQSQKVINQLAQHPDLPRHEFVRLARQSRQGDLNARDHIVKHNMRLVIKIAFQQTKKQKKITVEELILPGIEGLHEAIKKFDFSRNNTFQTYAYWWIRTKMGKYIRDNYSLIRVPDNVHNKGYGAEWHLRQSSKIDLDSPIANNEDGPMYFEIEDRDALNSLDQIGDEKVLGFSKEALLELSDREQTIIQLRFFEDYTLQEVADLFDISRERIRQLQQRAVEKMESYLRERYQMKSSNLST